MREDHIDRFGLARVVDVFPVAPVIYLDGCRLPPDRRQIFQHNLALAAQHDCFQHGLELFHALGLVAKDLKTELAAPCLAEIGCVFGEVQRVLPNRFEMRPEIADIIRDGSTAKKPNTISKLNKTITATVLTI